MKFVVMILMFILSAVSLTRAHASEEPILDCGKNYLMYKQQVENFNKKVEAMTYQTIISPAGREAMYQNASQNYELGYYALACNEGSEAAQIAQKLWDLGIPDGDLFLMDILGYLQQSDYQGAYLVYRHDFQNISENSTSSYWKFLSLLIIKKRLCRPAISGAFPLICHQSSERQIKEMEESHSLNAASYEVLISLFNGKQPSSKSLGNLPSQLQASRALIGYLDSEMSELSLATRKYAQLQYERLSVTGD